MKAANLFVKETTHSTSWEPFRQTLSLMVAATLVAIIVLLGVRIFAFNLLAPDNTLREFYKDMPLVLLYAIRWDIKIMAILMALPFLAGVVSLAHYRLSTITHRVNRVWIHVSVIAITLLSILNVLYWQAYNNPIDLFVFGLIEDDTTEILKAMWDQYPLVWYFLVFSAICWLVVKTINYLSTNTNILGDHTPKPVRKALTVLALLLVIASTARGSFSTFPLRAITTQASQSHFLNQLAVSAAEHMAEAFNWRSKNAMGVSPEVALTSRGYLSIEDAKNDLLFVGQETQYSVPLVKKSDSSWAGKPPNIIFVLMEGWSSHIVFDEKQPDDFWGEFGNIANDGLLFKRFVSTRQGTNRFIESTLGNSSFFDLSISAASKTRFQYSNIQSLINMGFQTGFIRGGSRSWYNQGNFWEAQGFDHYWDMTDIMSAYNVDKFSDWGVHDEYGFQFGLDRIKDFQSSPAPWFLFVETTTNHPPHVVPNNYDSGKVSLESFDNKLVHPDIAEKQLQTVRYMTDQLGIFLQKLKQNNLLDDTIVIATGDHTMWAFYQYNEIEDRLLAGSVPLYLHLPDALKPTDISIDIVGSHRDIFPTIFELAYPNAEYLKTGFDLFDSQEPHAGWHEKGVWMFEDGVSIGGNDHYFSVDDNLRIGESLGPLPSDALAYKKHVNAVEALIEWQFRNEYVTSSQKSSTVARSP